MPSRTQIVKQKTICAQITPRDYTRHKGSNLTPTFITFPINWSAFSALQKTPGDYYMHVSIIKRYVHVLTGIYGTIYLSWICDDIMRTQSRHTSEFVYRAHTVTPYGLSFSHESYYVIIVTAHVTVTPLHVVSG